MTPDAPLYMRDPDAWRAHLAEGNARQPRKRVSADVIVRDAAGQILLVDPAYKPDWDLPGGMAEASESPRDAAHRELREELGLAVEVGDLLCVAWVPPHGPWDDQLSFVFDGGELDPGQVAAISLHDGEISGFRFCTVTEAKALLRPYIWRRTTTSLEALETGRAAYLHESGSPH